MSAIIENACESKFNMYTEPESVLC